MIALKISHVFLLYIAVCRAFLLSSSSKKNIGQNVYKFLNDENWRNSPMSLTKLYYGKSGGKMIESDEEFSRDVLNSKKPVLAYFSAPWCGPCRLSNPVVRDVSKQFAEKIDAVEICTDDLPEIASDAGVVSIPTIQVYYNGIVQDTIVGCVAQNILATAISNILDDIGLQTPVEDKV